MALFRQWKGSVVGAEASGFFQWFGLERATAPAADSSPGWLHYRPGGNAFHSMAELVLCTDGAGRVLATELRLSRAFIDDPRNGLFARDITKSLLHDTLPGDVPAALVDLVHEIEFPRSPGVSFISARRPPALPEAPTPGYLVFLGHDDAWQWEGSGIRLEMVNQPGPDGECFRMRLA